MADSVLIGTQAASRDDICAMPYIHNCNRIVVVIVFVVDVDVVVNIVVVACVF